VYEAYKRVCYALSQNRQRHDQHIASLCQQSDDLHITLQTLMEPVAELTMTLEGYFADRFSLKITYKLQKPL